MLRTQAIGHLGNDCNLNSVNGKSVINFSIAHSEKFKDAQGNSREKTLWINCAYWTDKTAIAPYLKKGTMVFVEGQPEVSTYNDKQGKPQAEFKLRVGHIQLLGGNKENNGQQSNTNTYSNSNVNANENLSDDNSDLPF